MLPMTISGVDQSKTVDHGGSRLKTRNAFSPVVAFACAYSVFALTRKPLHPAQLPRAGNQTLETHSMLSRWSDAQSNLQELTERWK